MPSPIHPDVRAILDAARAAGSPPFEAFSPTEGRAAYAARRPIVQAPPDAVASIRDVTIVGPAGALALRVYRGKGTEPTERLPALVFMHGGGWVFGDLESHEGVCCRLANAARCCVVAVDYRLAPEHPFPAALDDAAAALAHVAREADAFAIDPARIAVGGDSAGGNLAAVLALASRDGAAPPLVAQLLLYPVTDLALAGPGYERVTDGMTITPSTMRYFAGHYAPRAADRLDPRASPLRAASLAGAAPAFVLTCGHDPLGPEGRAYAERLIREDVPVTAVHLEDGTHGFLTMNKVIPGGGGVLDFAGAFLADRCRPR